MDPSQGKYRIGAVAKLAGLPVATLRVWERRYGVVTPPKTEGGHRLYSDQEVLKVTLLKSLTQQGHAISTLAEMDISSLQSLLNESRQAMQMHAGRQVLPAVISLVVVGYGLASRLETQKFTLTFGHASLKVVQMFADVPDALSSAEMPKVDDASTMLVLQQSSVQPHQAEDILRLQRHLRISKGLLVYRYASEQVLETLKNAGFLLRREPVSDADLSDIMQSVLFVDPSQHMSQVSAKTIPPKRYSDQVLQRVASISTEVLCECPRHVADLISQLSSFEKYSNDCLNSSQEDAKLHAYLSAVSGTARALFEEALERVAKQEGIDLSENVRSR
jgi:DNA-binding transcriptional MerR regulator